VKYAALILVVWQFVCLAFLKLVAGWQFVESNAELFESVGIACLFALPVLVNLTKTTTKILTKLTLPPFRGVVLDMLTAAQYANSALSWHDDDDKSWHCDVDDDVDDDESLGQLIRRWLHRRCERRGSLSQRWTDVEQLFTIQPNQTHRVLDP